MDPSSQSVGQADGDEGKPFVEEVGNSESRTRHRSRSGCFGLPSHNMQDMVDAGEAGVMFDTTDVALQQLSVPDRQRSESPAFERSYSVHRPVYTQQEFDDAHGGHSTRQTVCEKAKNVLSNMRDQLTCDKDRAQEFAGRHLPFIRIMGNYNWRTWLINDFISGLTVGIMHIPQGMAYAMLASLPPVQGLYTSFFPTLVYFFLGTSRHISMGTIAIVSLLTGGLLERHVTPDSVKDLAEELRANNESMYWSTDSNDTTILDPLQLAIVTRKVQMAAAMCLAVGLTQLIMGIARLGFLTRYLSDPMISGFTTGASVHVFTSQIKYAVGVTIPRHTGAFTIPKTYYEILKRLPEANVPTVCISITAIIILVIFKEFINPKVRQKIKAPIPIELMLVITGTLVSYFMRLNQQHGVKIVGHIPSGIPTPAAPKLYLVSDVVGDIITTAVIAFSVCVSLAKIFGKKHGYEVDPTQEMMAYGFTNCFASVFQCYPAASSLSRSSVQESMGGETQLAGLISSALLVLVLLFIGPYFETVPNCCLSAIILVALKGMFLQVKEVPKLWKFSMFDFWTWILSCAATVILDVDYGLLIGVGFSIFSVILRTQAPTAHVLGNIPNTDIYKNVLAYDDAREIPGIKIYRYEGSLYYACAEHFRHSIYSMTDFNPRKQAIRRKRAKKSKTKLAVVAETLETTQQNGTTERRKNSSESAALPMTVDVEEGAATTSSQRLTTSDAGSEPLHHVIVDCSTWSYIDYVGVKVLGQVIQEYKDMGVRVYLANPKTGIREMFYRCDFYEKVDQNINYVSVHDAVQAALYEHRVYTKLQAMKSVRGVDVDEAGAEQMCDDKKVETNPV